jgi:hypothetical protein
MINKDYIINLKKVSEERLKAFYSDENNRKLMSEGQLDDDPFKPNTFLYIRAYSGDKGTRPIPPGIVCWLSPDIELYSNGALVDTMNPLTPNTSYTVQVTVTNDGDMDCNVCTVDLYLCEPSLGFSTRGALKIGIVNTRVSAHSTATVEFPFMTTDDMSGHRCMFSRAYSLASHDYPADLINFNTASDRHIGQQNLNIVKQGETFIFNINRVLNIANQDFEIVLKPIADLTNTKLEKQRRYMLPRKAINTDKFQFIKRDAISVNPKRRIPIIGRLPILPKIERIRAGVWKHKIESGINKMSMTIPNLGLKENEAVPMHLTAVNPTTGEVIGGITILVVG